MLNCNSTTLRVSGVEFIVSLCSVIEQSTHGSGNCATTWDLDDSLPATSQRGRVSRRVHKSAVLHDLRAYPGYRTLSTPRLAASAEHYRARDTTDLKRWESTLFGPKAYTSLPSSSNVAGNGGQRASWNQTLFSSGIIWNPISATRDSYRSRNSRHHAAQSSRTDLSSADLASHRSQHKALEILTKRVLQTQPSIFWQPWNHQAA